jgi:hypothetical protein
MSYPNMAGEDASLDSSVAAIAAKLKGGDDLKEAPDKRENRTDRYDIELQESGDLDEIEARERLGDQQDEGESHTEAEAGEGEKPEDEADVFIELPPAEEGATPERVPLTEALEAVKQLRQMNGEIATAVIKAEEEAYLKQDQITQRINGAFAEVQRQARAAIETMYLYAPQEPNPIMLDRNSGYYNPEEYHLAKMRYDEFATHYSKVVNTLRGAEQGAGMTGEHLDKEMVRRETERAARFIPAFKEERALAAWKADALEVLNARYGIPKEMLDEIVDHRALRIIDDVVKMTKAEKKAPEVKKHLTETKPKIVNGRPSNQRDTQTGRFTNKARESLRKSGTEEAFSSYLLTSGKLKDLL